MTASSHVERGAREKHPRRHARYHSALLLQLAQGATRLEAAAAAGVSLATVNRWIARHRAELECAVAAIEGDRLHELRLALATRPPPRSNDSPPTPEVPAT
jgi:hypothetical protein